MLGECGSSARVDQLNSYLKEKLKDPLHGYDQARDVKEMLSTAEPIKNLGPYAKELAASISKLAPFGAADEFCASQNVKELGKIIDFLVTKSVSFEGPLAEKPLEFMLKSYATIVMWHCLGFYEQSVKAHLFRKASSLKDYEILEELDQICIAKDPAASGVTKDSLAHFGCSMKLAEEQESLKSELASVLEDIAAFGRAYEDSSEPSRIVKNQVTVHYEITGLEKSSNWDKLLEKCKSILDDKEAMKIFDDISKLSTMVLQIEPSSKVITNKMFGFVSRIVTCEEMSGKLETVVPAPPKD